MQPETLAEDRYAGLPRVEPTLDARWYYDAEHHERELRQIWYREWVHVCRDVDIGPTGSWRSFRIGTQEVVVLRDEAGGLRAFHNSCRHRGAQLCQGKEGRFRGRLISCPYHAWSYGFDGRLVRVPHATPAADFDRADYPLHAVALCVWRGLVFVKISGDDGTDVAASLDPGSADLGNWPIESLVRGHVFEAVLDCNWKIFWENFNECLHCPTVHRGLSQLVPIYGRGLMARHDAADWALHADNDAPEHSGRLRAGAETWSQDGRAHGPTFAGLTEAERAAGQSYAVSLPSMFAVAHVDYVRTVRLLPLGPETTMLTAEWLFPAEALADDAAAIDNVVAFGRQVLEEDAEICAVNQRGLKALPHKAGVLMPEEYELRRFHGWVRERLDA